MLIVSEVVLDISHEDAYINFFKLIVFSILPLIEEQAKIYVNSSYSTSTNFITQILLNKYPLLRKNIKKL